MALYEMTSETFRRIDSTSFTDLKVKERGDLQRLLREKVEIISDDLYLLAEEFGEWEDSRRRIDLLAIDKNANLVVIELKRTHDGGHMELQAIRYASMVSAMTFSRAVEIHADFLKNTGKNHEDAESNILSFLSWSEPNEDEFGVDVRIILVSENFGIELTTAVLWLRDHDIDISCIRLTPFLDGNRKLVNVQPIIPLPEVGNYLVKIKEKEEKGKQEKAQRHLLRERFWEGVVNLAKSKGTRHGSIKPSTANWIGASSGYPGLPFTYVSNQEESRIELYIDRGNSKENKQVFDALLQKKDQIEKDFGSQLIWERLDSKRASRIRTMNIPGGYRTPEKDWLNLHQNLVSNMINFESAILQFLKEIG